MTTPSEPNALAPLGISESAERCYRHLLGHGPASLAALAALYAGDEDQAAAAVEALVGLGVASPTASGWEAQPLGRVARSLREQRTSALAHAVAVSERLDAQLALLRDHYSRAIHTVVGAAAIMAARQALLERARTELMGFDRPPYLRQTHAVPSVTPEYEAMSRGLVARTVYSPGFDGSRSASLHRFGAVGEQARIAVVPIKMLLVDRRTALLARIPATAAEVPEMCIVNDPIVVGALTQMFEEVWDRAVPLAEQDPDADRQASLIALLMAGYTDAAIAGRLGVTERSVRRWVARLMDSYGVRTRLQLGGALAVDPTVTPH